MEVTAKIRFTRPCLGNVRRPDFDRMLRDQDGAVIFMSTWWQAAFIKAATALNRYHRLAGDIQPALQVKGAVTLIKRYYGVDAYKLHEGFDVGAVIEVRFLLPQGVTIGQFTDLLETVGDYIGLSPYGWRTGNYGRFKVLEVCNVRGRSASEKSGQHTPGDS